MLTTLWSWIRSGNWSIAPETKVSVRSFEFSARQINDDPEAFKSAISDPSASISITDFLVPSVNLAGAKCTFARIAIPEIVNEPLELSDLRVDHLLTSERTKLVLRRCIIGDFDVGRGLALTVERSSIARMRLTRSNPYTAGRLDRLHWSKGYLGYFSWVHDAEPFAGDVTINGLRLPRRPSADGIQWLRDTRAKLVLKNNGRAASFFHAAELAQERSHEPLLNRIASFAYEWGSDFGNSIGRPLAWMTGLVCVVGVVAFLGGTEVNPGSAVGWRTSLTAETLEAKFLRAVTYALQTTFNPLNLLDSRPLVSVCSWPAALACGFFGLLGIASFALFLLSLRRRFKLE